MIRGPAKEPHPIPIFATRLNDTRIVHIVEVRQQVDLSSLPLPFRGLAKHKAKSMEPKKHLHSVTLTPLPHSAQGHLAGGLLVYG